MEQFLVGVAWRVGLAYLLFAAFICLLSAAELAFPREPMMTGRNRLRVVLFVGIYIPAAYLISGATWALVHAAGGQSLFGGHGLWAAVVAALVADFLYYWYHRAQHAIPWLWAIHSVHHSVAKMGAGAGYHHLLEAPLKGAFVTIPATLLFGGDGGPIIGLLFSMQGFYVHSTTRLSFGPFGWVLSDNRVHRIHHSRRPEHFNRNFGVFTLLWDRLFGTAYMPARDEWPSIGLDDRPEPQTIRQWLAMPFRSPAPIDREGRADDEIVGGREQPNLIHGRG